MSNPFAILADYPADGPAVPEREKVRRDKNKHVPGTGRRDKVKREGRGASNWGNALEDRPVVVDQEAPVQGEVEESTQQFEPAINFFDSDSEDEFVPQVVKPVAKIPKQFEGMIAVRDTDRHETKYVSDDEEEAFEFGFLNTQEALKQREFRAPRGGARPARGGPRGAPRGAPRGGARPPRGGARPPRPQGERRERPAAEEGEKPRPPRKNGPGLRDQKAQKNDHRRQGPLNINNFPSLK